MLKLVITCNAKTQDGLEDALNEARRRFVDGNTSGFDRNDISNFSFEVTGGEEEVTDQDQ